jgi:hypothetical protein
MEKEKFERRYSILKNQIVKDNEIIRTEEILNNEAIKIDNILIKKKKKKENIIQTIPFGYLKFNISNNKDIIKILKWISQKVKNSFEN